MYYTPKSDMSAPSSTNRRSCRAKYLELLRYPWRQRTLRRFSSATGALLSPIELWILVRSDLRATVWTLYCCCMNAEHCKITQTDTNNRISNRSRALKNIVMSNLWAECFCTVVTSREAHNYATSVSITVSMCVMCDADGLVDDVLWLDGWTKSQNLRSKVPQEHKRYTV